MANPIEPTTLTADAAAQNETQAAQSERPPLTRQEQLFLLCSLMLITCCFLPWRTASTELSPWDFSGLSTFTQAAWGLTFAVFCITPFTVNRPSIRPWFGMASAVGLNLALVGLSVMPGRITYGAELARGFALGLLLLSANPAILKAGDFAMRRLNRQAAEVITHWGTVLPGVHFSAEQLYTKVETEIRSREWPGVEFFRASHTEAGLLSHKREYLRVIRQRQVFDLCAATFGKDYFITLREAEIKAQLTLATLLIFIMALGMMLIFCLSTFGVVGGAIGFGLVLVTGIFLLFNVLRMGLTNLDGLLMRTPVIGPIYETWFRRSTTYFQHDIRMVFLKLMDDLVKARVDEETSAKGITLLSSFEHQPILDGLYKTTTRVPKSSK